jgi:hypothetical protein
MSLSYADIVDEALRLPQKEQLRLARTLLEHTEVEGDAGVEAAWEEEIARRVERVKKGTAKGRPAADVFRDLETRHK